jgi:hypothetical protein
MPVPPPLLTTPRAYGADDDVVSAFSILFLIGVTLADGYLLTSD